ncbi:MAG: GNAT family N-acetyltransferase [Nitriliruptorales bacterium]|nr:GNAT family N-acetyltransferase [Nitriliruptorales bacterium]
MDAAGARFRPARPEEAELLGEMTIAGVSYWGHDVNFPENVESLRQNHLPTPEYIEESPVFVLEEDGNVVGFYGLRRHDDFVDLVYMFLETDRIGHGYGRRLWDHAVSQAAPLSDKMRILSDPGATRFYAAMGASKERELDAGNGFRLTLFWYDLPPAAE